MSRTGIRPGAGYPILGRTGSEFNCRAVSARGVVALHFSDSYLEEALQSPITETRLESDPARPRFDPHLMQLFRLVHDALLQPHPNRLYLEHLLAASVVRAIDTSAERGAGKKSRVASTQLERAEEYIRAHFDRNLRLGEIAGVAGMSPYHFSRAFRAYFGAPPTDTCRKSASRRRSPAWKAPTCRSRMSPGPWGFRLRATSALFSRSTRAFRPASSENSSIEPPGLAEAGP